MKKVFVEPDIQRLKLNLRENIATSSRCAFPELFLPTWSPTVSDHFSTAYLEAEYLKFRDLGKLDNLYILLNQLPGSCMYYLIPHHEF